MHSHSLPATCLILLVLPLVAVAEPERRYDVELVIFENTDTSAGERERWRAEVTVPELAGAIALEHLRGGGGQTGDPAPDRSRQPVEIPEGFEPLPPDQRRLGGAIDKLEESDRFRVLRHLAWRQPALDDDEALAIRARHGEPVTVRVPITDFEELYALEDEAAQEGGAVDGAVAPAVAEPSGSARTFSTGPMSRYNMRPLLRPIEVHPLDGTVRVVVSRYLHVYTDLYFTTPVQWTPTGRSGEEPEPTGAAAADQDTVDPRGSSGSITSPQVALGPDGRAMLSYPFVQHRRMRSGELHYLDHPVVGMLILVDRAPEDPEDGSGEADGATGDAGTT